MVKWKTLCLENKLYYIEAAFSFFIENFARFNFAPFWSARDAIPPSNDYVFFDNSLNCFSTTTFQSAAGIYHAAVLQFPNTFILSMDAIWIEYNDHVENVNTPSFLIFTSFPLQFFFSNRRNFDILKKEMRKEMCWFSNVTFRTIQKKIIRFGCRIKKKIIWSKFARAFIFFLSSEKCGSKMYASSCIIINIVIEQMVKFSRNNFQTSIRREKWINKIVCYPHSFTFLRHIQCNVFTLPSNFITYSVAGSRLCSLRIANRWRIKIAHPSEFHTSSLERIRSRFLVQFPRTCLLPKC